MLEFAIPESSKKYNLIDSMARGNAEVDFDPNLLDCRNPHRSNDWVDAARTSSCRHATWIANCCWTYTRHLHVDRKFHHY